MSGGGGGGGGGGVGGWPTVPATCVRLYVPTHSHHLYLVSVEVMLSYLA